VCRTSVMESFFGLVGFAANSFSTRPQRRLRILPLKLSRTSALARGYAWNVTLRNTAKWFGSKKGLWNAFHNCSVAPKTPLANLDPTETFDAFLNRFCRTGVH
jgi:hypothetical protein